MKSNMTNAFSQSLVKTIGATTLFCIAASVFAGEKVDKTIDSTSSPKIDIEHVNGKADIRVWDKSQVRVTGELGDQTEKFVFERRSDVVVIHIETEHRAKWYQKTKDGDDLVIYVPASSDVHYTAVNADVSAKGITTAINIDVVNGDVELQDLGEKVEVESVNGDITLEKVMGYLSAESVNGDVLATHTGRQPVVLTTVNGKVDLTSNSPDVTVETVNGRIELALDDVDSLQISTVNGKTFSRLSVNEKGNVQASSVGGGLEFEFQKGVSAQFDIEAHAGGDIINHISDDKVKEPKYGPSSWLRFIHNGGAANVDISTVHGRIEIDEK